MKKKEKKRKSLFICCYLIFRLDTSSRSSSTASSVEIYTVMGLFNNGKNEKVEKVNKSERREIVSPSKSHRRSAKHPQNNFVDVVIRPTPQFSFMPNSNLFQGSTGFPQFSFGNYPQFKFASPYDLSKYGQSSYPFAGQSSYPFAAQSTPATFPPAWFNGMSAFNDRSPFQQQQPLNAYQQNGWSYPTGWNSAYYQPYNF
jgi:hypothetical protein